MAFVDLGFDPELEAIEVFEQYRTVLNYVDST